MELLPRPSHIISLQMGFIQKYRLHAEKIGTAPDVHIRILPHQTRLEESRESSEAVDVDSRFDDFLGANGDSNGSSYMMDRLPLLPDEF